MKIIFSITLFLWLGYSFAQTIPTYCLSISASSPRNLCGTPTYDGNYVVAGIVGIGSNQNNFVAKCDGEGHIVWSNEIGSDFVDDFYGVVEASDHSIVLVGYLGGKMCMVKFDENGNEIWKKQIVVQAIDYLNDIIETSDGNYLLAGTAEDVLSGWNYCAVIKVSPDGNLLWNKNLYEFYHAENGYACTETRDHRYVISAYDAAFSDQILLISLDESGNMQWVKRSVDAGVAYDLIATTDSGIIAAGYMCTTEGCNPMIAKVDTGGNLEWSYTYGDTLFGRFYSIAALDDGGFVMAGDATDQSSIYHGFIVKCDSIGQMQWGKINNATEFRSVGATSDGGIVASSTLGGFGLVKMDADGNSCPDCLFSDYGMQGAGTTLTDFTLYEFNATAVISDAGMTEYTTTPTVNVYCNEVGIEESKDENSTLTIFPNPVNDKLTIMNIPFAGHVELYVKDMTGRTVMNVFSDKNITALNNTIQLDCTSLIPGMYVIVMNLSGKIQTEKFTVQH